MTIQVTNFEGLRQQKTKAEPLVQVHDLSSDTLEPSSWHSRNHPSNRPKPTEKFLRAPDLSNPSFPDEFACVLIGLQAAVLLATSAWHPNTLEVIC